MFQYLTHIVFPAKHDLGGYKPTYASSFFNSNLYGIYGLNSFEVASKETRAFIAKYNTTYSSFLTISSITIDSFGYMAVCSC